METAPEITSSIQWRAQVELTNRIIYSSILSFEEVKLFSKSDEVRQNTEHVGIIPRIIVPLLFKKYDGPENIKSICIKKIKKER